MPPIVGVQLREPLAAATGVPGLYVWCLHPLLQTHAHTYRRREGKRERERERERERVRQTDRQTEAMPQS